MTKLTTAMMGVAGLALVGAAAWADGIPGSAPLVYSATLTDGTGAPAPDLARAIEVSLWADATSTATASLKCTTSPGLVSAIGGRFDVVLDAACSSAVSSNPDLWVEVKVLGAALPRTRLGAVPSAIEAKRATAAAGALETRLALLQSKLAALGAAPPRSMYRYEGGNGVGSTSTKIRRYNFERVKADPDGDLSCVDSATAGLTCTVLKAGVYHALMREYFMGGSPAAAGISRNSNQLATGIGQITAAHRMSYEAGDDIANCAEGFFPAAVNDVIRPHTDVWNNETGGGPSNSFMITRVSN